MTFQCFSSLAAMLKINYTYTFLKRKLITIDKKIFTIIVNLLLAIIYILFYKKCNFILLFFFFFHTKKKLTEKFIITSVYLPKTLLIPNLKISTTIL